MADTNHSHAGDPPVEGDGISYRGIVWFVGVLAVTTVASQVLMFGLFKYLARDVAAHDTPRPKLAAPAGQPPPGPNLLTDEPGNLAAFREEEQKKLSTYDWIDKSAGTVRIPIDRAKALLLERGLPVRGAGAEGAKAPAVSSAPGKEE